MTTLILIETSTSVCSAALSRDGEILLNKENFDGQSHSVLLGKFVKEIIDYVRENSIKIDGVAVSCGPGSYTGLRIGVSLSKGLCYGLDVPLIAINTLQTMALNASKNSDIENNALLCPMIDARRMEVYSAFFDLQLNQKRETCADIIDESSYAELLENHTIYFFGNGAGKCKETLKHPNAKFIENISPLAKDMTELAEKAYKASNFQDVAYFEPFYLKEFVATVAKNKVI